MASTDLNPFWSQVLVGGSAYNEGFFSSNPDSRHGRSWAHYLARRLRYEVYWGHYEQNIYKSLHLWAEAVKDEAQLYSSVRSIYSPAYRVGEFWAEHLYGGVLDYDAGDGSSVPSSVPVRTDNPALRPVLAKVWRDSNWQAAKDVWTRYGSVMGDTGLMVCDDPRRKTVTLCPVHPRVVRELKHDGAGNCTGYVFEERRADPRGWDPLYYPQEVTYTEICSKVGGRTRFQTFLDAEPYDWRDYSADPAPGFVTDWTEGYGFVPFVFTQHRDLGLGAGWSEIHSSLSKLMELDNLASKLADQVYKTIECAWLFSGVRKDNVEGKGVDVEYPEPTDADPEPEKTRLPVYYAKDPQAKPHPLVAPLQIKETADLAMSILRELERDHPELQADMANSAGDASGRALRVARERAEARVVSRRAGYDDALVRAQKMAVSIGAMKGYPGFEGFTPDSYDLGELDHSIGPRPVFAVDSMDHLEEAKARADVLGSLVKTGVPIEVAMEQAGYGPQVVTATMAARSRADAKAKAEADAMKPKPGQILVPGAPADKPPEGVVNGRANGPDGGKP